jgi:hypothetical protein
MNLYWETALFNPLTCRAETMSARHVVATKGRRLDDVKWWSK